MTSTGLATLTLIAVSTWTPTALFRDAADPTPLPAIRIGTGLGRMPPALPIAVNASASARRQMPEEVEAALRLDRPTRRLIQRGLRNEGFDPGTPDGLFGPRTRAAIRRWQAARGSPTTGYLDAAQAEALRAASRARLPVSRDVAASVASAQADLASDDIDRIARAVVRVVALASGEEVSWGSGTLVDRSGLIFTNRHVVEGAEDLLVEVLEDPNELPVPRYRARVLAYSMDVDFAVLQIDRDGRGQPIAADGVDLPFLSSSSEGARRGDEVFVFGYPGIGDGYYAVTEGTITTIRNGTIHDRRLPVWYLTDAEAAPGNSGGLAVNSRGEMVGIPSMVRTEQQTGGRLAGILPLAAVRAALDGGLATDLSRIAADTRVPVIEGGALDFDEVPTFGSAELSAGFSPDPYRLEMVSGGEVEAGYLGRECVGYAAVAPDFRVNWSGNSAELRVLFTADDSGDTTLIINLPDGSWICNDDAAETVEPMVVLRDPSPGQYDIWVGSYEAGAFVPGTLYVTERNLDPVFPWLARALTLKEIVSESLLATGGTDALASVESVRQTGTFTMSAPFQELEGQFESVLVPNHKFYQHLASDEFLMATGWNGTTAWEWDSTQGMKDATGVRLAELVVESSVHPFWDYGRSGLFTPEYSRLDDVPLNGRNYHVVRVTWPGILSQMVLVDTETMLVSRVLRADEALGTVVFTMTNYEEHGGVMWPANTRLEGQDGSTIDLQITAVEINGEVDHSIFEKP